MKDFFTRNKVFIFVILGTCLLLFGGIYLMTKGNSSGTSPKANQNLLVPVGVYETSGLSNGAYLPASTSAKVTFVEFGDYQCPACGLYHPLMKQLLTDFAGKINYVFRDMAFIGTESTTAAEASYCAADLGKYWEYHDYLYTHQNGENEGAFSSDKLKSFASALGIDSATFSSCLDSGKYKSKVDSGDSDANLLGITSTPTFYLNGVKITLDGTYDQLKNLIQGELNK